jgi:hypothetical protein
MERLVLPFNTDVSGQFHDDGAFNEALHERTVRRFRAYLRKRAGVVDCIVDRFEIQVQYRAEIVRRDGIIQYVREAIAEFIDEPGLFPQRGEMVPDVVVMEPPSPTHFWVTVRFATDLVGFQADAMNGGQDLAAFRSATKGLVDKLVEIDGVVDWSCTLTSVALCFRIGRDTEAVKVHMTTVLKTQMKLRGASFFPYLVSVDGSQMVAGEREVPVLDVVVMETIR